MFRDISYVSHLNLLRNNIKKIKASSLIGLKADILSFSFNYLEYLEDSSIPEVEELFINGNKLVSIHSKIFVNISKIKILDVSFNKITDFSFQNSMFQRLNMKNNKITHLSKKSFLGMNMLNEIILSNNMISSLEMKSLPLVKNLDLSHNLLSSIDLNMFTDIDQVRHLDLTHNCIKQINLKFTKKANISIGIFNKMCNDIYETDKEMSKSNDKQEADNEMSKSNDIQEMDNVLISKNILYIIGAVIVVAVLLANIIVIIYSRRFYKYSKKAFEPRVVFNNELIPNAIPNDNNGGYVEPAHVYEVIDNNAETQRESYGYLVPRSKKRQEAGDEIRNVSSKA
ncbi:PREDICTED: insulin-like growth factor-binding protein complex acid labile subunit [Nicrophorus vespilloides]|uniref:Insulin-like growth factor-binding protein complex acid labile subunit n=1 Tax=Nicrophorus vespilloides TaxID=110193 RepID=A0ABM1NG54_NICVS|nr:PREDICTED: insulin-like growth factor-binding protein complex acid labile subunit [Nicrophorus vespilloides]